MIKGNVTHKGYTFRVVNNGRMAQVFIWHNKSAYHRIDRSGVLVGCVELVDNQFERYIAALEVAEIVYKDMVK